MSEIDVQDSGRRKDRPLPPEIFRRKLGARKYQDVRNNLESLDAALQLDNYATAEAVWYDLAAVIMRRLRQDGTAKQCEQLRDEAVERLDTGRMRKTRKKDSAADED